MSVIIISYLPTLLQQTTDTKTIWGTLKTDKKYSRFWPHFETRIPMIIMSWRNWQFITKRSEIFHDCWANIKMDFYKYCLSKNVYLHLFLITSLRLYLIEEIYLNTIKMIIFIWFIYISIFRSVYMNSSDLESFEWRLTLRWLFWIMSIPTTFRLFRVLTSELIGRRLPVFTLLLWKTSAYHSRRCGRL